MRRMLVVATLSLAMSLAMVMTLAQSAFAQGKPTDLSAAAAELEARVARLEASGETNTLAIAQISTQLSELTQRINALGAAQTTGPDLVGRVDEVSLKAAALEREVETLRTQVADLEQPYSAESSGGSANGFTLTKGDFSATLGAYFHTRWQFLTPSDFATITQSSFRIRRARMSLKGNAGKIFDKQLSYKFSAEFSSSPALRDYYVDLAIRPELSVRMGQAKIGHGREFLVGSTKLLFPERSFVSSNYRYDRDLGVWAHGEVVADKVDYSVGVTNGGGLNAVNDNIDFAVSARIQGAALGKLIPYGSGDIDVTEKPALTFGASAVHDLVQLPEVVGGTVVMERDVDSDEVIDNVRVLSLGADATLRVKGAEVTAEGYFRRESWGTILDHSSNEDVRDVILPSNSGTKNYFGGVVAGSYFVWPKTVAVGTRLGYSRQTFLGVGGRGGGRAPADRLLEYSLASQLYYHGKRLLGVDYTLINYDSSTGADPQFDIEHRFIVESQIAF